MYPVPKPYFTDQETEIKSIWLKFAQLPNGMYDLWSR